MKSPHHFLVRRLLGVAILCVASACSGGDIHLGQDAVTAAGQPVATGTVNTGVQGGGNATTVDPNATASASTNATDANGLLDPNAFFMGVHINYDADAGKLATWVAQCGFVPPVVAGYVTASADGTFELAKAEGYIDDVVVNKGKEVSLAITAPITTLSQTQLDGLRAAVTYGKQKGLTVDIRYGYEMNGNWSPAYHDGDPNIFLAQWAQAEAVVHAAGGLMVWAPNVASSGGYEKWMPDMATVDKVGLDMYHQTGDIADGEIDAAFATIYPTIAAYKKPFFLSETGVVVTGEGSYLSDATEAAKKMIWLKQLTSSALRTKYPLYTGFVWFDYQKQETASGLSGGTVEWRNFSISADSFAASLVKAWYPTVFAVL